MFTDRRAPILLVAPAVLFIVGAFLTPIAILLSESVIRNGGFSLSAYSDFFTTPLYQVVFWRTIKLGALVTVFCAAIAYAVALVIVDATPGWRGQLVALRSEEHTSELQSH